MRLARPPIARYVVATRDRRADGATATLISHGAYSF